MKLLLNIFTLIFLALTSQGQMYVDITSTSDQPGVGDKFKLTYELKLKMEGGSASISHSGIKIKKPTFKGFTVLDEGRASSGFGFGGFGGFGGDMKISDYAFILQAKKKGTYTILPLTFIMNGEEHKSESYTITIGEGDPNAVIAKKQNSNLFTRIDVSKKNPYKGESVLVTYKIYSRYRTLSLDDYDYSLIDGAWTEEIKPGKNGWDTEQEVINNATYNIFTLKKEIIFPQKTGEISIPAFKITARINQSFFNQGKTESATSNSQKINVKKLPSPKPESFVSQVGTGYKMKVSYSTTAVKSNEAIDLKIKITGKGNLKQLEAPVIKFPTDFEVYDPEVKENIKLSTSGLSGSKEFSYLIIPRHHGDFTVDGLEYSYFDTGSKKYKTLKSEPTTFNIAKGEDDGTTLSSTANKEDVELLSNEIRHIEQETELYPIDDFFFGTGTYFTLLATPALLFFILLFITKRKTEEVDEATISRKNASKIASKRLAKAESCLSHNEDSAFFEELYTALNKYLSDKLHIPVSGLKKSRIEEELLGIMVDSKSIAELLDILNNCEMARFAPISHSAAEQYLSASKNVINTIESHAKK